MLTGGSPKTYTDEEIISVLVKCNGLISRAAKKLGCTPRTIYLRRDKNPEIARIIHEARSEMADDAEEGLKHHLEQKAPWAIALALKTLGKDRGYVERVEHREITDEELDRALDKAIAKEREQLGEEEKPSS